MLKILQLLAATGQGTDGVDGAAETMATADGVATGTDEMDDVVDADDLVRSILSGLAFPVLITDAHGNVTHANDDAESMFDRDASAMVGQPAQGVYDRMGGQDLLSRTLETGQRFEEVEDTFDVDGELPVSRSVVPITCAAGTVRGAMTIDRDISERVALREREELLEEYQRDVLDRLQRNLVKLGKGDLTIDPTVPTPPADFEAMTNMHAEFEEMTANLTAAVEQVKTSLESSRRRADRLQSVSQEMSAISQQTAAAIDEIGGSSDRIADAAERQVSRAADAESNIASLSASIEEITASTQEMESLSEGAVGVAREGAQSGRTAVREIRDANEASEKNIEMIRSLEAQMGTINEMADMISDISDQVHLLALNANIEAARAGEDGHGFTVVANEVKSLAEKSSDAVSQISGTLDELKAGITETSETIAEGNEQVRAGVEAVEEVVESVDEIAEVIEETNAAIDEIAAATEEQAHDTETVRQIVEDVSEASNEVSGGIQQVSAGIDEQSEAAENVVDAAVEVGGMSQEMLEMLEQFRLSNDENARLES